jgi:excisionase family DNA binding protein
VPDDLTTRAAAKVLGVHPDTLARWADDGKVPHWRTPGNQRRFRRSVIEALRGTAAEEQQAAAVAS